MPIALTEPDAVSRYRGPAAVPRYDRAAVHPGIVHLGVGAFHRAHQAVYVDDLLATGQGQDWGIVGVGILPSDSAVHRALDAQRGLYTVLERGTDTLSARVVGSLTRHLLAPDQPHAVATALADPATRIVTLTVTQGGYYTDPTTGALRLDHPDLRHDVAHPGRPRTHLGFLLQALVRRRQAGAAPFTVLSCDNLQGNGVVLRRVLTGFADAVDPALGAWVSENVALPSSMVDRITPPTSPDDRDEVERSFGLADAWPVSCEPFRQWVVEDHFPTGRPALEQVGVQFVPDVAPYELMKLRLLNAGHQALAYFGHLCGYEYVHEATADPLFPRLLLEYMEREASPTLGRLPGVDLGAYRRTLVERFANRGLGDTVERLCRGGSTSIPTFLLPVVRDQLATGGPVRLAAAVVAAWARYAEGLDEHGRTHELVDGQAADLSARAHRQRADPLAFVRGNPLFVGLDTDPRFTAPYLDALTRLHRDGARGTLEHLLQA